MKFMSGGLVGTDTGEEARALAILSPAKYVETPGRITLTFT